MSKKLCEEELIFVTVTVLDDHLFLTSMPKPWKRSAKSRALELGWHPNTDPPPWPDFWIMFNTYLPLYCMITQGLQSQLGGALANSVFFELVWKTLRGFCALVLISCSKPLTVWSSPQCAALPSSAPDKISNTVGTMMASRCALLFTM